MTVLREIALVVSSAAALTVVLGASPRRAFACSPVQPFVAYETSADDSDDEPPQLLAASITLVRARTPGVGAGDCGDLASYRIEVDASDDVTPTEDLGFTFELVEGSLPFTLPSGFVEDAHAGEGNFRSWFSDDGAPIAARIEVRVVDRAGNVSDPFEVGIRSAGEGGGCSISQVDHAIAASGTTWLALAGLGLAVARRRSLR